MLKGKRSFDPLFEALWKKSSTITSLNGGRRTCLLRIWVLVLQTTECSLDRVCLRTDTKKHATYTFSVIGPFADVEVQLASFNDRIFANSGNPP